ncbi:acyltransferase (plasmid) [Sphingomonas paeninsulae]|uniref:Acyltransferase n=1 Tax=Sphingomonas paeninsulae TaxID=2319844 RepID=A0A494TD01_SPHPE|nr:acyltransferase [Sphingomonas paeninsulae]AYJ84953.1 acyltransferase [Sphingomonas paeninsulae]
MNAPKLNYNPALDGIRALAASAVLLVHLNPAFLPGGWIGVDVFFVLSGFLITRILQLEIGTTGSIDLKRFYIRRAIRLVPALLAMVMVVVIVAKLMEKQIITEAILSLTYTMNWAQAFDIGLPVKYLDHTWSLAVEEQFYLVWPIALLALRSKRPWAYVAALLVASLFWRGALIHNGATWARTYHGFDTHSDTLLIGSLLALFPISQRVVSAARLTSWIPATLLLMCCFPMSPAWTSRLSGSSTSARTLSLRINKRPKRLVRVP